MVLLLVLPSHVSFFLQEVVAGGINFVGVMPVGAGRLYTQEGFGVGGQNLKTKMLVCYRCGYQGLLTLSLAKHADKVI